MFIIREKGPCPKSTDERVLRGRDHPQKVGAFENGRPDSDGDSRDRPKRSIENLWYAICGVAGFSKASPCGTPPGIQVFYIVPLT